MPKKDNPFTYKHFIDQHLEAYSILKKKYPLPIDLFFVKAYLLGRIIELILKTELILKGHTSSELRKKKIGSHNLEKLIKLLGFPDYYSINPITYDTILHLNVFYNDKRYEYPQSDDVEIKNVSFLEEFINLSINKLNFHLTSNKLLEYSS